MRNVVKRFAFEIQLLVSPVYFLERCHYCWKLYRSNFSRFSSFASPSSSSSSSSFSSSLIISDNTEFRIDSPRLPLRQTIQHCAVSNNFATHDGRTIPGIRDIACEMPQVLMRVRSVMYNSIRSHCPNF